MLKTHSLGFPKIGKNREWKKSIESFWKGKISLDDLLEFGKQARKQNWQIQAQSGLEYVPVGDFNFYDHILNYSLELGVIPKRFNIEASKLSLEDMFFMARGRSNQGKSAPACEMTKWFDTNYHYIVPEFESDQTFSLTGFSLIKEVKEALKLGLKPKVVFIGPVSYLWLGKAKSTKFDKLSLLDNLIKAYQQLLVKLVDLGVEWIQLDEPVLGLEIDDNWKKAFTKAYALLNTSDIKIMVASYFSGLADNADLALNLNIDGLHIDCCFADEAKLIDERWPKDKVLSLGVVNGRSIWINDIQSTMSKISPLYESRKDNLWLAPSCSLLHCPVDLDSETLMEPQIKSWMAFSYQKLIELNYIKIGLLNPKDETYVNFMLNNRNVLENKKTSKRLVNQALREQMAKLDVEKYKRKNVFSVRKQTQKNKLNLPLFPTTTIGSFPQTTQIRKLRLNYRRGDITKQEYEDKIKEQIKFVVDKQLEIGLDVLVHGEPERNDMVEYFGEHLEGFVFSENGWVQSYGSRCVKPPIIYGDVSRLEPMTVFWSNYANSLTDKPLKGMLTGPVTILRWSFVRDDLPEKDVAMQIALSIRKEAASLEEANIKIIQIDEPAFREGMPLKKSHWPEYLKWAVDSFLVCSGGVKDETQIHTHMCYSEFNEIIDYISKMDADVISIEASRSDFELIDSLKIFSYPNDIGPGVYDIHSPNVPTTSQMVELLKKATSFIDKDNIWVNPDCGLKTRSWKEVLPSLKNMVTAAKQMRQNS